MTEENNEQVSPIIIGPTKRQENKSYNQELVQESFELYLVLYSEWRDADIMLEGRGYPLQGEGKLNRLSDRIESAINDAREQGYREATNQEEAVS